MRSGTIPPHFTNQGNLVALTLAELMNVLPQRGVVDWMGVRPARDEPMLTPQQIQAHMGKGLTGDRFKAKRTNREVTFIQGEHIDAIASMLGRGPIEPATLRRNIVVRGLNLLALKDKVFQIGDACFEFTGLAHPCSKMEAALGAGGYNAMRGHGGITTCILRSGTFSVGDEVFVIDRSSIQSGLT
jgi:MOSC domain-containing protein YiiM